MRFFGYVAIAISILFIGGFAIVLFSEKGMIYSSLNSGWTVEIHGKKIFNRTIPIEIDKLVHVVEGDIAFVENNVEIPKNCSTVPCYIFLGEVGDLVKVWLNGKPYSIRGYGDHSKTIGKHYPFWVQIPSSLTGKLNIRVQIETLFGMGFGLARGPAFIGDYLAVRSNERHLSVESVVLPLMQALLLGILGLLFALSWSMTKLPEPFFRFSVFAFSASAFMLCFSFIPREFLPVHLVGFTHYELRLITDWSLFELLNSILPVKNIIKRTVRTLLAIGIVFLFLLLLNHAAFAQYVYAVRVISVVIVAIPVIGFITALSYYRKNQILPVPRELDLDLLIPTLGALSICQSWDTMNFWTWISGPYLMKFYLAPLAFVFSLILVRKVIREQKTFSRKKAEAERDALLGQIAIEFSHDLKTPLTALKTCADIALETGDEKYMKKVLGDVARRTTEVTNRLQELLDYSRDEIKEKCLTSLGNLVQRVGEDLSPSLKNKNIKLAVEGAEIEIKVDDLSFGRALNNLVQNAIDASPENTMVRITGTQACDRNLITVQDFGRGIHSEDLSKVFDPYFTKGKEKGTGLGLSIVDRIVRQHGGSVKVFSNLSKGTTFVMEVPN